MTPHLSRCYVSIHVPTCGSPFPGPCRRLLLLLPRLHPQRMLKYRACRSRPSPRCDWAPGVTDSTSGQWRAAAGEGGTTVIILFCAFPGSKEQSLGRRVCVTSPLLTATASVWPHPVLGPQQNPGFSGGSCLLPRQNTTLQPPLGLEFCPLKNGDNPSPAERPALSHVDNQFLWKSPGLHVFSQQTFIQTALSPPAAGPLLPRGRLPCRVSNSVTLLP